MSRQEAATGGGGRLCGRRAEVGKGAVGAQRGQLTHTGGWGEVSRKVCGPREEAECYLRGSVDIGISLLDSVAVPFSTR